MLHRSAARHGQRRLRAATNVDILAMKWSLRRHRITLSNPELAQSPIVWSEEGLLLAFQQPKLNLGCAEHLIYVPNQVILRTINELLTGSRFNLEK